MQQPPPPLRVEYAPPPPAFDAYWVHGHWNWDGREYIWAGGHWVRAHPAEVLERAHWENQGGRWVFIPERWVPTRPPAGYAEVVIRTPPPLPRVEQMPPPPSPDHFWVAGHWRLTGAGFVWEGGHWEAHRAGMVYVHPHWAQVGATFRFSGGYWQ